SPATVQPVAGHGFPDGPGCTVRRGLARVRAGFPAWRRRPPSLPVGVPPRKQLSSCRYPSWQVSGSFQDNTVCCALTIAVGANQVPTSDPLPMRLIVGRERQRDKEGL